jgi:hypothetical protein
MLTSLEIHVIILMKIMKRISFSVPQQLGNDLSNKDYKEIEEPSLRLNFHSAFYSQANNKWAKTWTSWNSLGRSKEDTKNGSLSSEKLHTTISKLWRGLPNIGNATHGRQSTKNLWDSIMILQTFLYPCWVVCCNLVQIFQNIYFFKMCIIKCKITKRLFEMHASMRGTSQHHN